MNKEKDFILKLDLLNSLEAFIAEKHEMGNFELINDIKNVGSFIVVKRKLEKDPDS